MSHSLRIIALGGLGEVGKNMMAYEYAGEIIIVDTGLMFPDNDMLGIDYLIPDFHYLLDKREQVKAIFITHGHEDHIGAIHHVLEEIQAPIYATPLTRGLIEVKLARHGMSQKAQLNTVQTGEIVQVGNFRVEFFHVSHSIPDAAGLAIETPAGLIIHTGDYKFDQTPVDGRTSDFAKLAEFSRRGVLALLGDSTNAERPGWTPSERVIDPALDDIFTKAPGRIIIASFASLISRMQQVANATKHHGRRIAIVGTSMVDNVKIANKLGYLDIPDDLQVSIEQAINMPANEVVIMCTGAQGEPTSILGRLSAGSYRLFDIQAGDTVVLSSHTIPGNEETVNRTINHLFERGANVVYEGLAAVHVSGHASQEELMMMINLVKPKYLIPIHGEIRHLVAHAHLGQLLGIPEENISVIENGQVIEFKDGKLTLGERVSSAHVFVDGSGVGDVDPEVMREREALARDGVVLVQVVLDKYSGSLIQEPLIISRGFILMSESDALLTGLRKRISDLIGYASGNLQKDLEQTVRSYISGETGRKPMVFVNVTRV